MADNRNIFQRLFNVQTIGQSKQNDGMDGYFGVG